MQLLIIALPHFQPPSHFPSPIHPQDFMTNKILLHEFASGWFVKEHRLRKHVTKHYSTFTNAYGGYNHITDYGNIRKHKSNEEKLSFISKILRDFAWRWANMVEK